LHRLGPHRMTIDEVRAAMGADAQFRTIADMQHGTELASGLHRRLLLRQPVCPSVAVVPGRRHRAAACAPYVAITTPAMLLLPPLGKSTGPNPTDRSKRGTKRSLLVDGRGVPLGVVVAGANRNDHLLLEATLASIPEACPLA